MSSLMRRLGWLAFTLMWIPFAGIFVGMLGVPAGSYGWAELPILARYSMLATGALFSLSMLGLIGAPLLSFLVSQRVLHGGELGEAEILDLDETGTTINEHPLVGFRLRVHPLSGSPLEAETERVVPRLQVPRIQPGARVQVRYDPKSKKVAIMELDE